MKPKTADRLVLTIHVRKVAAVGGDVAALLRHAAAEWSWGVEASPLLHDERWCGWYETEYAVSEEPEDVSERGWYYLHTNGDLIFKRFEPEDDSDFVKRVWAVNSEDRADAWRLLLEAAALGASLERLKELTARWGVMPDDLANYMRNTGVEEVNRERKTGMVRIAKEIWNIDLDTLFEQIKQSAP